MKYNHRQYAQALYEAIADTKAKDHDVVIGNFIEALKKNGDLAEYEKIVEEYERYEMEQKGIREVEVTTSTETKLNKSLLDDLNEIVGKDISVKHKVDNSLIGGVVIRAGDTLIDGSVKHQLEKLRKNLTQN